MPMNSPSSTAASAPSRAHWWATAFFRGMGQVFFMDRPLSGMLMLVGLLVADPWLALFTAVAIGVGTLTATVTRLDRRAVGAGLHGYCAALVGAASYVTWGPGAAAWASAVLGSIAVVPVTLGLAALLRLGGASDRGLPVLTAPFCIVSGAVAILARGSAAAAGAPASALDLAGMAELTRGTLAAIGQVHFADSAPGGLLILCGLLVASWRAGVGALIGATTMTAASLLLGVDPERITHGLTQYSAVLVGIAVMAVFLADVRPRWVPWVVAVIASLATLPVQGLLAAVDVPVYTWPFVLVTWLVVGIQNASARRRVAP